MVEEQVQVVILSADFEVILAADKSEPLSQLQNQRSQMLDQTALKISLLDVRAERKKIEAIRVFNDLLSQFQLLGGQCAREIGESATLPSHQSTFDLMNKDIAAPAVVDGLPGIPLTLSAHLQGVGEMTGSGAPVVIAHASLSRYPSSN